MLSLGNSTAKLATTQQRDYSWQKSQLILMPNFNKASHPVLQDSTFESHQNDDDDDS